MRSPTPDTRRDRSGRVGQHRVDGSTRARGPHDEVAALIGGVAVLLLTTVHHVYGAVLYATPERYHAVGIALAGLVVMAAGFIVSRRSRDSVLRRLGWWTFWGGTALVPVLLFGAVEGVYNHVVKLLLFFAGVPEDQLQQLYPDPTAEMPNDFIFEFTGVLQAVPAGVAAFYLFRLLRTTRRPARSGLPLFLSLLLAACTPKTPVEGTWHGVFSPATGIELRVAFHLHLDAEGGLHGTMDSPDQGAEGIPVFAVAPEGDSLTFRIPRLDAEYRGVLTNRDTIYGEWRQMGQRRSLDLVRSERLDPPRRRPQETVAPAPYQEEEVRFARTGSDFHLSGTLTVPDGPGPHPAVVLISGSGPLDRDGTIMGHRPFLVLADHLSRRGTAVLRYDKRGVGRSEGDFWLATLDDFVVDAAAAAEFLRDHPEVDPGNVGVIGHSEGALVGPRVAAEEGNVAFMVLMAPPGLPAEDGLLRQEELVARAMGATERQVEDTLEMRARLLRIVREVADPEERRANIEAALVRVVERMRAGHLLPFGVPADAQEGWIVSQARTLASPAFRALLIHDPGTVLQQVRVPVLALFGELDLQVPPAGHLPVVRGALEEAGNADTTILELPRLNHLFQTATTGTPAEYGQIPETLAPPALEAIAVWLRERSEDGVNETRPHGRWDCPATEPGRCSEGPEARETQDRPGAPGAGTRAGAEREHVR